MAALFWQVTKVSPIKISVTTRPSCEVGLDPYYQRLFCVLSTTHIRCDP